MIITIFIIIIIIIIIIIMVVRNMDNKGYPNFHFLKRQNCYLKLNLEKRGTKMLTLIF